MKKYLILFLSMFLLIGCSLKDNPKSATEALLKKYQTLSDDVISDLDLTMEGINFSEDKQKEDYAKTMKMQYSDLKYEIIDEKINGDEAVETVKISVYDFYKVQKEAENYRTNHEDEFMNDGIFDNSKFTNYKIKQMMDSNERIEYTIDVKLTKNDKKWVAEKFDKTTLEKIHGLYNYENE